MLVEFFPLTATAYNPPRPKTPNSASRSFRSISKCQIIGIGKKTMAMLSIMFGMPAPTKNEFRLIHLEACDNCQSPDIGIHSAKTAIPTATNHIPTRVYSTYNAIRNGLSVNILE